MGKLRVGNVNVDIANYVLPSHKLDFGTGKRVVLIADLHGYQNKPKKREAIIEAIRLQKPHHIVIAGDHMRGSIWLKNGAEVENFHSFVRELSLIAPVILSQGNHDIQAKNEAQLEEINTIFRNIANVNPGRVFPLINGRAVIDGFEIIGFTPSNELMESLPIQMHGKAHDKFIEEYSEKGVRAEGGDDTIVEYAGHSPYLIGVSENGIGLEGLIPVDAFFTGHLHNGYVKSKKSRNNPERYMDRGWVERPFDQDSDGKMIPTSIRPFFGETNLCRGVVYVDDMSQQRILQLRNGHFYYNDAKKDNVQHWVEITREEAEKMILDNKLHALIITGGLHKYTFIPRVDEPEVTVVDYKGTRKK